MNLTNKFNLPEAIYEAVKNDGYTKGNSDISVTQLIDSPYIRKLKEDHYNEIEEDVTERVLSLLGQAVHTILERTETEDLKEERLYWEFEL